MRPGVKISLGLQLYLQAPIFIIPPQPKEVIYMYVPVALIA
jgi:hypothetical protein